MKKKVLAVVTSHEQMKKETDKTGLWLSELVHFYDVLKLAGFEIDIVSVDGGKVPIDPKSLLPVFMDTTTKEYRLDPYFISKLDHTISIDEVSDEYGCIFFAGGHGTMWDFPDNLKIKELTSSIYEQGGIVSAVCHGPTALLNVTLTDGSHLLEGKKVTGYSDMEEKLLFLTGKIPYSLQKKLSQTGANYKKASIPFTSFVQVDQRIVTGQNPQSAREVGEKTLRLLQKHAHA